MEKHEKSSSQGAAEENRSRRDTIRGWQLHPGVAVVLLGIQLLALALLLLIPKAHMVLRAMPFGVLMFCGGVTASRHMAIWQRDARKTD
ncbi:hypothetical protein [Paraburkholderia sp. A3RO-2L]|jgi:uncharacterized membrane protein HdeD (DUF308 family)|uniref:hypothetical protein n=1 Tax=Paraburkholderia sp. A3RO-2L TaxID=3028376 RepID=UPI00330391BC|nr:hypothetical protein [Burkholderia vietnamiensis]